MPVTFLLNVQHCRDSLNDVNFLKRCTFASDRQLKGTSHFNPLWDGRDSELCVRLSEPGLYVVSGTLRG